MDPFEPQLVLKKEVRFSESLTEAGSNPEENFGDVFGGIIKSGQWGWLTKGSNLRITSLRTGQLISSFMFDESNGFGLCIITCVSEVLLPYLPDTVICIGIQYSDSPGGLAVIYSVEQSSVIRCIELKHKITCCRFINLQIAQHTVLQNMNGCLAVGTDGGSVLLLDLNLRGGEMNTSMTESSVSVVPCHIVDYSMSLLHLHRHFQHCQQEGVHFGIQLEVLENAEFIQSLLPIDLILSLAVGLADGRLALYDLTDMQVFYVAPPQERSSPLVKMNFMEPPDDPRSCVYIWAFHENYQNSMAVMHSLMYEKRVQAEDGFCYFENFQVACVRLLLPLSCPKSVPITCQAITKAPSHGNEETVSLCALVWKQDQELQTEVLLFDINLWYKEEMPYVGDWREDPSYLASFILKGISALEVYINPNTISLFNSIQRPEEHFYPVSLSFDSVALGENSCVHVNWPGAQNRVIDVLRTKGSLALLDPNPIFNEILNTGLLPQFSGLNCTATFSLKAKREALLSVAIEQNCIGLLKECAKNWSDGSHQGKSLDEGLSMSTLTDWLWARASCIKDRCNNLCQVLFDHSGCTLDQREQKELGYISRQLKTLADLLNEIVMKFGENIRSDVLCTLETQSKSIRMASEYQEILLWLLNIGLLPEASRLRSHRNDVYNHVPYPYEALKRFYENRRSELTRLNEKFSSRKTRSCYLLFIDSFIEHEFTCNSLRDSWQESGGNGLYPPTSIQAMLRVMLIPDVTFDDKCALFLYFFLDLNMAIEDKQYEGIVQNFIKFPSVFKLSASLIKQIQAFWNLDHGRFQAAVDEFVSPFNKDQVCPQWQLELFLESILAQNEPNLCLRVLEAKSTPISPVLQMNTYLANDLISEAFHFARSKQDDELLKLFFTGCLCTGKFGVIRDLALTEKEGNLVQSLLKNSKSQNAENLHFVYLLQKNKYIEAVSYLDELSKGRVIKRAVDVDTPTLVLSAYNTTMTPVSKGLSDVYFKIKNKIKNRETEQNSPYPLSCQLIKQNANDLLGGIYHSSALSTHFASHYWEQHQAEGNTLQQSANAPFLRRPQVPSSYLEFSQKESISYPEPYKAAQKRRLENSFVEEEKIGVKLLDNPKKRRKVFEQSDLGSLYKSFGRDQPPADNLLTHFKNAPIHAREIATFTRTAQKTPPRETVFFLETPYVKNTVKEELEIVANSNGGKPPTALQGILKVGQSNSKSSPDKTDYVRAASIEPQKKKETEEEKIIRFNLPTVDDESEGTVEEMDMEMESEDIEKPVEEFLPRLFAGPAKRKSLRSYSSYNSKKDLNQNSENFLPALQLEAAKVYETTAMRSEVEKQKVLVETTTVCTRSSTYLAPDSQSIATDSKIASFMERGKPEDANKEPATRVSIIGKRKGVSSRLDLRAPTLVQSEEQDSSDSCEVVSRFNSKHVSTSGSVQLACDTDTTDDLNNANELSNSESKPRDNLLDQKRSKRAFSESSNESTYSVQRNAKQLKGRVSIHNPSTETAAPTQQMHFKSIGNVLKADTVIDFKPHVSSSRVCATESKFSVDPTEVGNVSETTSKVTFSERSTIVGGLSFMPTMESHYITETISVTAMPTLNRMMDTTVDMTVNDTMVFEKSHQPLSCENSNSLDAPSGSGDHEEELTDSESNVRNELGNSDDSGSVILLSSRSNSPTYYEENSEQFGSRTQDSKGSEVVIDVEKDDDDEDEDSDGVDIVEDDYSNSYSNQFSEVTRSSTSCSALSNQDTVLSSNSDFEVEPLSCKRDVEEIQVHRSVFNKNISADDSSEAKGKETYITVELEETSVEPSLTETSPVIIETEEDVKEVVSSPDAVMETELETSKGDVVLFVEDEEYDSPPKVDKREKNIESNDALSNDNKTAVETKEEKKTEQIEETAITSETTVEEEKTEVTTSQGKVTESKSPSKDTTPRTIEKNDVDDDKLSATVEPISNEAVPIEESGLPIKADEELTPYPTRRRSKSFNKTISTESDATSSPSSRRISRGGSLPPVPASQIVTRRRSLLLETLDENATPSSPSTRTRSKLRLDSIDGDTDSPSVSSVKRSRLSSISSVTSTEPLNTPKTRHRSSMSVDKELISTPKTAATPRATRARSITADVTTTPLKTPRRLSISKKDKLSPDQPDPVESSPKVSTSDVKNPETEGETSQNEDFHATRRLTRTQLAVMEKSAAFAKQFAASPAKMTRGRPSRASEKGSPPTVDAKISDTESISSHISQSSRRVTRSSALKENADDDTVSIASSTESSKVKRKRAKEPTSPVAALTAIPEEESLGSEESAAKSETSAKLARQKKKVVKNSRT